jgi:hypothetical protein
MKTSTILILGSLMATAAFPQIDPGHPKLR